jgi:hypothetical protein
VIPRARGGRRKDTRIIVPACARCNHRRGCREVVLFLLDQPRRIAAFLDYLHGLPPETVRELDIRVFAELYAAVWLLGESAPGGRAWRERLRHLCSGRRLHRRRYAARRIVSAVAVRLERARERGLAPEGASCPLPGCAGAEAAEPVVARTLATLVGALSLLWDVPAERVAEELERERRRAEQRAKSRAAAGAEASPAAEPAIGEDGVVSLDGWRRRGRRRRARIDQRKGRGAPRRGRVPRGRAA